MVPARAVRTGRVLGLYGASAAANFPQITEDLMRDGAFVPGIRPGRDSAEYLRYVSGRVIVTTPLVIGLVAVLPTVLVVLAGGDAVLGTGVLLLVGAALTARRGIATAA